MGLGKTYSTKYLLDSNNSSGVAGQVLSTTSTGIDWADANTLPGAGLWLESGNNIYNSNSGNVGIGATSPNAKLHIAGGSAGMFLSNLGDNSAYDSIKMSYGGYNSGTPEFIFTQTSTPGSGIVNTWYRFKNTNGVEGTNPNNVANVTIGGKLGVGTDTPGESLEILKDGGAIIKLHDPGNNSWKIKADSNFHIYDDSNSDYLTILNNGNVGIGTTGPQALLDVRKDIATIYDPLQDLGQRSGTATIHITNQDTTVGSFGQIMYDSDGSNQGIARIVFVDSGTASVDTAFVNEHNNTKAERMRITSAGGISFGSTGTAYGTSGQVLTSAGNASPTWTTPTTGTVTGTGVTGILPYWTNGPGGVLGDSIVAQGSQRIQISSGGGTLLMGQWDGSNNRIESASRPLFITSYTSPIKLGISGSTTMTIESSNVGIGTTSPQVQLHVAKNSPFPNVNAVTSSNTGFVVSGNDGLMDLLSFDDNTTVATSLGMGRYSQTTGSIIDKWGLVTWYDTGNEGSNLSDRLAINYGTSNVPWSNSEKVSITREGNVGIGTTSPDSKLDIEAAINPTIRLTNSTNPLGGADVGTLEFFTKDTSSQASRVLSSIVCVNEANSPSVPDGQLAFKTSLGGANAQPATEKMRIDPEGNVGIGTISPDTNLEIVSTSNTELRVTNDSATDHSARIQQTDSGTFLSGSDTSNVSQFVFRAYGDSYINGGNVGIGTDDPQNPLHIKKEGYQLKLEDGNTTNTCEILASNNTMGFFSDRANAVASSDMIFSIDNDTKMVIDTNGNVGIGATGPLFKLQTNSTITGSWLGYLNGTSATFGTNNFSAVHSSTAIGTGTESGINLANNASDVGAPSPIISFSAKSASANYQHAYAAIYGIKTATGADTNWNKGDLVFATGQGTGPNERMRIDDIGRVGIGTDDPIYTLDVVSTGDGLLSLTGGAKPTMRFRIGTSTVGTIQAQENTYMNVSAGGTSSLNLQTAGTTSRLTILTGGNVGINQTAPAGILHVQDAVTGDTSQFLITNGTGATLRMGITGSGANENAHILTNSGEDLEFQIGKAADAVTPSVIFKSGGNVGIGTNSPNTQLEILNNNDQPATLRLSSSVSDGDAVAAIISFQNEAGGGGVQGRIENIATEDDASYYKFYTDDTSSPSMTLFDSGNMTIAGTLTQNSDVRLKENIKPIESALDKVKQMQGVEFNKINSSTKEIGVVAQEIEKIIPELVLEDKEGIKSVAYSNITAVLIEAIKEQQKQIEELKQQLNK